MSILDSSIKPSAEDQADRFTVRHLGDWLVFCLILYISSELDRLLGLWLLLIPLLTAPALIASCSFVVGFVANLWKRRWKRLVSVVVAPVITVGLLAASFHYGVDAGWVSFQLKRHIYMEMVRSLPQSSAKYHEWSWGSTGGDIGTNVTYTLVYDETDKPLTQPKNDRQWQETASVQPYGHHFFLVTELR
ncbi:hypothetical protein [Pseudomonas asplenii]|uniref:hypothetical protein n=1 Tax=Pseudomonas asplenii TaxID=53407 RepID=UPI0003727289|nr:hypothetical protein [Pseudomonas fuscovaginae]